MPAHGIRRGQRAVEDAPANRRGQQRGRRTLYEDGNVRVLLRADSPLREPNAIPPRAAIVRSSGFVRVRLPRFGHAPRDDNVDYSYEYAVERYILADLFPNTITAIQNDTLDLEGFFTADILRNNSTESMHEACRFLFEFAVSQQAGYGEHGGSPDPFEHILEDQRRSQRPERSAFHWGVYVLALCIVLHRRYGLACGRPLLDQFLRFMGVFLEETKFVMTVQQQGALFTSFLGVFNSRCRSLRLSLRDMWFKLDVMVQRGVMERLAWFGDVGGCETIREDHEFLLNLIATQRR